MPSQTRSPTELSIDNSFGSVAWVNPSNAAVADGAYATATVSLGNDSNYLEFQAFEFSIPLAATITGILAEARVSVAGIGGGVFDVRCRLVDIVDVIQSQKSLNTKSG